MSRLISYISPPITAVFLFGVFWKKATGRAALLTLIFGGAIGMILFPLDFWKVPIASFLSESSPFLAAAFDWFARNVIHDFMLTAFYLLVVCSAIMVLVSLSKPEPLKEEARALVWENWREPLRGEAHGHALGNYRILAGAVFATFVVLYFLFR